MSSRFQGKAMQIQHFFEYSVDNYPNNIALVCNNTVFTYSELELHANQLANYLIQEGIQEGDMVGILLERSIHSYIAILGVLKAGAAYVPIEVEYPEERINYIFKDMPFRAALTSAAQLRRSSLELPKAIVLDEMQSVLAQQATSRPIVNKDLKDNENLCYVIYTSGSTGKPKGVEITHRSICHYVGVASDLYEMTANDRVYQGFSLAFDASLEELWMAFANGATLVGCTDKDTRSGVGLIEFLEENKVTVFSTVPTLLANLEGQLPNLRLLILGGEACTASLVKRWSRFGLRIMNTYGPTEATVIATYTECYADHPITIGRPLPGYEILILDENLQPVANGEAGELCIGGRGLARGYVNSPEMTEAKFVINPANPTQRIYRTGDLAMVTSSGEIQFLGRIDDQIKLRGFRIELNEIEAIMMEHEAVSQAVVSLQELDKPTLVAYLMLDKRANFELEQFKSQLHATLPHYMIPSLFEIIENFPLLASGKVDRKKLPTPTQKIEEREYIAPTTPLEKQIAAIWETTFQCGSVSINADFFYDLGGHSLLAAKIVSNLRTLPGLQNISILDLYNNPTIKQLAKKFCTSKTPDLGQRTSEHSNKKNSTPTWMYYLCGLGQIFGALFQTAINAWQLLVVIICYSWATEHYSFFSWHSFKIFLLFFLTMPIASLTLTIAAKWFLLGRVKPGKYKLWGWFYLRWWLVERLQKNVFSPKHLIGTPLIGLYYRLLGAKIGRNCYIGTVNLGTLDAIEIGDNTSIAYDVRLYAYVVEDGWLKIGRITIGDNCYIGARSVVSIDTIIENNAVLDDMSMLPRYSTIPTGQFFSGSPASHSICPLNHVTKQKQQVAAATRMQNITYGILHYFCLVFAMAVHYLCFIPGILLVTYFYEHSHYLTTTLFATLLGAATFLLIYFIAISLCKKIIMGKIKPGVYPLKSLYYLRQWTVVKMLDIDEIYVMADTLYFPLFLRFLGANIGKHVEMGETPHIIPELITIQDGGFTASSVALAWPTVYNGTITFGSATIGKRGFIGNMSLLPLGTQIGDGGLLGCMSITPPNNRAANANTSWLGSPAVFLPKREIFLGFSDKQTFTPSRALYFTRLAIEFIRIIMPTMFSFILIFNTLYVLDYLLGNFSLLSTFLLLPIAELGITLGLVGVYVGLKWLILGKLCPATKPIWDIFIWKNDVVEYLYSYFVSPFFTNFILGTPFVSLLFRAVGAKIGKRVFIDTADFTEFDLITIKDDVCINSDAIIQTHLYEDRIFKMSSIEIKEGCNIGVGSIVLYNTVMEKNSTLGNFSLLMKGERLPANTSWRGIPAQSLSTYYEPSQPESPSITVDDSALPELDKSGL